MKKQASGVRSSNIELLRILCMFLIVAHHFSMHSGFTFEKELTSNSLLVYWISLGGKLGVNVFVLISGYFLGQETHLKWKRILRYVAQVMIFSLAINGWLWVTGIQNFSVGALVTAVAPLLSRTWWFSSVYFVLCLLQPYVNRFLDNVDKWEHLKTILFLCVIWSVMPTLLWVKMEGNELTWFVLLYIIAVYIRKYQSPIFSSQKIQLICLAVSTALIMLSVVVILWLGDRTGVWAVHFADLQSTLLLVQSVSVFCVFRNLKMKPIKWVNLVAAAMYGVYLIHDHPQIRKYLWEDLLQGAALQDSAMLPVHAFQSILSVFVLCTCLSLVYTLLIQPIVEWGLRAWHPSRKTPEKEPRLSAWAKRYL